MEKKGKGGNFCPNFPIPCDSTFWSGPRKAAKQEVQNKDINVTFSI